MSPFVLTLPSHGPRPVLVEVPHAGLEVPPELAVDLRAGPTDALRDADPYVDRLAARVPSVGATLLCARYSRYVVDLNRAPDDVSRDVVGDHPDPRPTQPRGVVWATTTDGRLLWPKPLEHGELARRLSRYHAPYHAALAAEIERLRATFGHVIVVSLHSMPSTARGVRRADVVPGTRGRTTASSRVIDAVEAHFKERALSVRHDDPYRGGFTTGLWGRPAERIHAVQVELSRALYLDERTSSLDERGVAEISDALVGLVERLGALTLD